MINVLDVFFLVLAGTGVVYLGVGFLLTRHPPKQINQWYGYRTSASMRSPERWCYAQQYAGRLMVRSGVIAMAVSPMGWFIPWSLTISVLCASASVIGLTVVPILLTERALTQQFGNSSS